MVNEKFLVEDTYKPIIKDILGIEGFTNIKEMPRHSLFDFIANKGENVVFIEAKSRSPAAKTQTFVITKKKLERLSELKAKTNCEVYLIFINKHGHKTVTLQDFLDRKTDMKPLQIVTAKGKDTGSFIVWQFDSKNIRWHHEQQNKTKTKNEIPSKRLHAIRLTKEQAKTFTRHFYLRIDYEATVVELNEGRNVFVEGITRQTAHFASKKLTEMMNKNIVYAASIFTLRTGEILKGYLFTVA
jgi:Holliday junction resolvase